MKTIGCMIRKCPLAKNFGQLNAMRQEAEASINGRSRYEIYIIFDARPSVS